MTVFILKINFKLFIKKYLILNKNFIKIYVQLSEYNIHILLSSIKISNWLIFKLIYRKKLWFVSQNNRLFFNLTYRKKLWFIGLFKFFYDLDET